MEMPSETGWIAFADQRRRGSPSEGGREHRPAAVIGPVVRRHASKCTMWIPLHSPSSADDTQVAEHEPESDWTRS